MAGMCCGCICQNRLQGMRRIWGGHNLCYRHDNVKESQMKIFTEIKTVAWNVANLSQVSLTCTQNNVFLESGSLVLAKVKSQAAIHVYVGQ